VLYERGERPIAPPDTGIARSDGTFGKKQGRWQRIKAAKALRAAKDSTEVDRSKVPPKGGKRNR
jgi:hypothetical protein